MNKPTDKFTLIKTVIKNMHVKFGFGNVQKHHCVCDAKHIRGCMDKTKLLKLRQDIGLQACERIGVLSLAHNKGETCYLNSIEDVVEISLV